MDMSHDSVEMLWLVVWYF